MRVKAKTIFAGFFMVVLGAAFAMAPLFDDPAPECRPNQVCPTAPLCAPGKTCPIN
jgi:hypothetical protein